MFSHEIEDATCGQTVHIMQSTSLQGRGFVIVRTAPSNDANNKLRALRNRQPEELEDEDDAHYPSQVKNRRVLAADQDKTCGFLATIAFVIFSTIVCMSSLLHMT